MVSRQAEAVDLTGKRWSLTVPEQGDQSSSGGSNQDQPAQITRQVCSDEAWDQANKSGQHISIGVWSSDGS